MTPQIRLLRDEVLLKLIHPERMTASKLLIIPEHAQREAHEVCTGVVVATGPGKRGKYGTLTPCDVVPGDHVQFYWLAGKNQSGHFPDENHRIIEESYIQCRFDSGKNPSPLGKRILVERAEPVSKVGGLTIPARFQKSETHGRVFALGSENSEGLRLGDIVRFPAQSGSNIDVNGRILVSIPVMEIQCVMEEA